jgi:hypothetical protein
MSEPSVWRSLLAAHASTRSCAGCEACCTIMEVRELEKPAWAPCVHLAGGGGGCSIWGDHPGPCKAFACLWRGSDALLPPELFPADCGFMLALDPSETWPTVVKVCAEAGRPDAWDTPANRALFAALAAAWNCPVAVIGEGVRASHVFAPMGGFYSRAERPELFPHDGAGLALGADDWGPDRRPPAERIAAAGFHWRDAEA